MSFTFYPIDGTEPSVISGVNTFLYSEFRKQTFFVAATPVGYIGLYTIDENLVITLIADSATTGWTSSGLVEDPTNGDIFFVARNSSNNTGLLYKWTGGATFSSIYTYTSSTRPESIQYIDDFLYHLSSNNTIYRLTTAGTSLTAMGTTIPLAAANSALVSKEIRVGNGKFYLYGSKAVFESTDLITWTQTHVPTPYQGAQTSWFITTGFEFEDRHICLVRFDTTSTTKTAIYELKAGGVYEELCPAFNGDCQGWGVIEGYIFLTSGYTGSPNRSLFSVISKNGHVYINKPCAIRYGIGATTPFVKLGNRVLWPHSTAYAISDPISWIDSLKTASGWIMGG